MVRRVRSRLTKVLEGEITLDGKAVPYIVKRSTRARHVRLEIRQETGLILVIPRGYPVERLSDLLKAKQRWILGNLAKTNDDLLPSVRQQVEDGDFVLYLGRQLKVVVRKRNGAAGVRLEHDRLMVTLASDSDGLYPVLEQWYRTQAARLMHEKAEVWSDKLDVNYSKINIRGQKSRWGSCSRNGNISFNWKLVMAPEPVIDYVVIHELAHIKQMNHSKRFWQLVADYCPEWREYKKWLRLHEDELKTGLFARQLMLGI